MKKSKALQHAKAGPVRADARRNVEAVLRAAVAVFKKSGVDAPVREIAQRAGVGVATIYRHFPQRSDLIVAIVQTEVDACAELLSRWRRNTRPPKRLLNGCGASST